MGIKSKELIFTPVDALSFRITGGTSTLEPHKSEDIIYALEGPEGLHITLDLAVEVKRHWYIVNSIKEEIIGNVVSYKLSMAERTKSSTFLMPMIGGDRSLFFWNSLFVNCHLYKEDDKYYIALVYRFSSDPLFIKFEQAVKKFESFSKVLDPDPTYVVFILNIPVKQKRNFNKFMKGLYSQMSQRYKDQIIEFHNFNLKGVTAQVLYKQKARRKFLEDLLECDLPEDSELLSIIDMSREMLNMDKYIRKNKYIGL